MTMTGVIMAKWALVAVLAMSPALVSAQQNQQIIQVTTACPCVNPPPSGAITATVHEPRAPRTATTRGVSGWFWVWWLLYFV
jgi:hypothetical protein